ncbi:hypothetical protein DFS34DRAFT_645232 [Phlyctochytrium arcticum]|nr:hypothetical protein DFS34DRAFT_645232 [Phlyctochytrium arcticum]
MSDIIDPATLPDVSYFPRDMARSMVTEVRSIAAGLGTNGLAEHADKIESGLNRMGRGMDSAGKSIRAGLIVVGIGIGIGLTVMGCGMLLTGLGDWKTAEARRARRKRSSGRKGKRGSGGRCRCEDSSSEEPQGEDDDRLDDFADFNEKLQKQSSSSKSASQNVSQQAHGVRTSAESEYLHSTTPHASIQPGS